MHAKAVVNGMDVISSKISSATVKKEAVPREREV